MAAAMSAVSATNLQSTRIRGAPFRDGLLSFICGSMILATLINLVAGLSLSGHLS